MNRIMFVKIPGVLFVGGLVEKPTALGGVPIPVSSIITLTKPRMVFIDQEKGAFSLVKNIGEPDELEITGSVDYSYFNKDKDFEKFYTEEVCEIKGLSIVK